MTNARSALFALFGLFALADVVTLLGYTQGMLRHTKSLGSVGDACDNPVVDKMAILAAASVIVGWAMTDELEFTVQ